MPAEYGRRPIPDGITDPTLYEQVPMKILLILKEPYDKMKDGSVGNGGWEHDIYLKELTYDEIYHPQRLYQRRTEKRVSKLVSCVLRNLKYSDFKNAYLSETEIMDDFRSIAWINVGKYPAPNNTTSSYSHVKQQYIVWRDILFKQLDSYNPDVVIFGQTFGFFYEDLKKHLGDNLTGPFGNSSTTSYWIDTKNNRLLIQTSHPGFRYLRDPQNSMFFGGHSEEIYIDSIVNAVKAGIAEMSK